MATSFALNCNRPRGGDIDSMISSPSNGTLVSVSGQKHVRSNHTAFSGDGDENQCVSPRPDTTNFPVPFNEYVPGIGADSNAKYTHSLTSLSVI